LNWLSQSPELNPIEYLWIEIDNRFRYLPERISNKNDLWNKIQQIWNEINIDTYANLIHSMPERICNIIKVKGSYTRW
jgi:hypothetical protein